MFNFHTLGMANHFRNPYQQQSDPRYAEPGLTNPAQPEPYMGQQPQFQGYLPNQLNGIGNDINQMNQYNQVNPYSQPDLATMGQPKQPMPFTKPAQQPGMPFTPPPFHKPPGQYALTGETPPSQRLGERAGGAAGFNFLHRLGIQPNFGLMSQTMGAPQTYNPFNSGLSQQR